MRIALLILLTALSATAAGQTKVFKSTGEGGETEFSDRPATGSEAITVKPAQGLETRMPELPRSTSTSGSADATSPYRRVQITSPRDDEALVEHSGRVSVSAGIEPQLRAGSGHRLQFKLDGSAVGTPAASMGIVLENVDRGTHQLSVDVVDRSGRVIASSTPITFHLQRTSVLRRQGAN